MTPSPTENEKVEIHPSGDERYFVIDRTMERYSYQQDALLETLNAVQETFGYLSPDLLSYVSSQLSIPLSQVYGVATFYHMYTLEPTKENRCFICSDPACLIAGSEDVLAAAQSLTEHAHNGGVTIEPSSCLGLCDQGPAALLNNKAYVDIKPEGVERLFRGEAKPSRLQVSGDPRLMTRFVGQLGPTDLESHRAEGAFAGLEKALTKMSPEKVIAEVKVSGLTGRGGAGFPTGLKWEFTRQAIAEPKYVVCNFDESEPGTFKDRLLMEGDPFRVLEGILLSGYAVGSSHGYIFIRGEYPQAAVIIQGAIDQMIQAGLLGRISWVQILVLISKSGVAQVLTYVERKRLYLKPLKVIVVTRAANHHFPQHMVCLANRPRSTTWKRWPSFPTWSSTGEAGGTNGVLKNQWASSCFVLAGM
jgi:NADH-quinone oxidoreductase subunit F